MGNERVWVCTNHSSHVKVKGQLQKLALSHHCRTWGSNSSQAYQSTNNYTNDFLCVTKVLAVLETHFVDQGVWPQTHRGMPLPPLGLMKCTNTVKHNSTNKRVRGLYGLTICVLLTLKKERSKYS